MIIQLVAGIALFLFGMHVFEETIRTAFGDGLKKTIQRYVGGLIRNIGLGFFATIILHSSMITIMLILGFLSARMLTLTQGIGMVLGANIGTTMTPWLIASLGFSMDMSVMSLYIVALGGILLIAGSRYKQLQTTAKFVLGFGLLFLGLGYMKSSVEVLSASFSLAQSGMGLLQSVLLGLITTVVLQTSTGSLMLALTALSSGMITFDIALGFVIGANLGSAISPFLIGFLSSTAKQKLKRILVTTHLGANIFMMIFMLILLHPVMWLISLLGLDSNPMIGIATFHTVYNIIGVIILAPFVNKYVRFLTEKGWLEEKKVNVFEIAQLSTDMPEEYLSAMKNDVSGIRKRVIEFMKMMSDTKHNDLSQLIESYTTIKQSIEEWMNLVFSYDVQSFDSDQKKDFIYEQQAVVMYLSSLKQLKDIANHYYTLQASDAPLIQSYMEKFNEKLIEYSDFLISVDAFKSASSIDKKKEILAQELRLDDTRFLSDIRKGILKYGEKTSESLWSQLVKKSTNTSKGDANEHLWSQLIKINRSFIVAGESLIESYDQNF